MNAEVKQTQTSMLLRTRIRCLEGFLWLAAYKLVIASFLTLLTTKYLQLMIATISKGDAIDFRDLK